MSLKDKLTVSFTDKIDTFITCIADKYNINKDELLKIANSHEFDKEPSSPEPVPGKQSKSKPCSKPKCIPSDLISDIPFSPDMSYNELLKYKKTDLQCLCRKHKKKSTGTKQQLVSYLLNVDIPTEGVDGEGDESVNNSGESSIKTHAVGKVVSQKKTEKKSEKKTVSKVVQPPVIKKVIKDTSSDSICVIKNKFGNLEDKNTGFVFTPDTHKVYGKQENDGSVADLTSEDIQMCKQQKLAFMIPKNLNAKKPLVIKQENANGGNEEDEIDEIIEDEEEEDEVVEEDDEDAAEYDEEAEDDDEDEVVVEEAEVVVDEDDINESELLDCVDDDADEDEEIDDEIGDDDDFGIDDE